MNKAQKEALGKLFEWEVNSSFDESLLPPRLKKSVADPLIAEGLIVAVVSTLPGWPPVEVEGHALTIKGHAVYCAECADEEEPEDIEEGQANG